MSNLLRKDTILLISHRGNLGSLDPSKENSPHYIDEAILSEYDVEIDVRYIDGKLYLGHDTPDYETSLEWLLGRKHNLWVHCKNFAALSYLIDKELRTFYHQKENHTIINNCNLIWSHQLDEANEKSIIPLLSEEDIINHNSYIPVYGICSDFVSTLYSKLKIK